MLTTEQKTMLSNIIRMIEISKETLKENKEVSLLKNFLIKNFDPSEEKITKIVKILELNEKLEFKIEKETSEYFMLKGFLLILKDLGVKDQSKYVSDCEKLHLLEFQNAIGELGYLGMRKVCLHKEVDNIKLTIFEGNHEMLTQIAFDEILKN